MATNFYILKLKAICQLLFVDPPRGEKFLHFAMIFFIHLLVNPRRGCMEGGETRLERRTDVGGLGQRKREAARRKGGENRVS